MYTEFLRGFSLSVEYLPRHSEMDLADLYELDFLSKGVPMFIDFFCLLLTINCFLQNVGN